jgi:hypothetical protein
MLMCLYYTNDAIIGGNGSIPYLRLHLNTQQLLRSRISRAPKSRLKMTADTDPESSQLFTLSDIDISHNELPPQVGFTSFDSSALLTFEQFWATILTFVTYPKSVKEMSTRFLYLILTLARMAANLAAEYKASEDALPPKLELALKEATKLPLQKEVQKGKRKTELLKRPSKKIRLEHQTLEDLQDLEDLSPDEDTQATTPPPTTFVTTPRHDLPLPQSLSPSGKGDGWRTIWEGYISQAPQVNSSTQKPYTWPGQLTHLLEHIWGPGGAGNVLKMAAEVIEDFSLYVIDANTAVSDISSPTREIEIRMKRIWGMSKATGVKQAELILEYKLLAETMFNIEQETFDTRTQLGQLWHARVVNPKLEVTDQARSNFVLQQVQQSMGSENTTDAGKGNQMKRLRREREFANNIALFIRLFGWGIVPLLANAPWKQV